MKNLKLKVLMVSPGIQGPAYYSYQLSQALQSKGSSVIMLTMSRYDLKNFPHIFSIKPYIRYYCPFSEVPKHIREFRDTYLHLAAWMRTVQNYIIILWLVLKEKVSICHFQWPMTKYDQFLFRVLRFFGIRVVYTVHNLQPHESESLEYGDMDWVAVYRETDTLIAHTRFTRQGLIEKVKIRPEKIAVIPHGGYPFYFQNPLYNHWSQSTIPLLDKKKVILFFGSIRFYKGVEVLLQAFPLVKARVPDCKLVVGGAAITQSYADHIRKMVADDDGDIILHLQKIPLSQIPAYFMAAAVVVLPYLKIDQSGVLLTAYTFGKPVVASGIGGFNETVEDGKSGFLVAPGNVDALAYALINILSDDAKREQMGAYAKQMAETKFSWEEIATRTVQLYHSLC